MRGGGGHAEAEERFHEAFGDARLLMRGRFDVWLDDGRLIWVRDRCAALEERFFLHVWPVDPDDLPAHRREHGFDNLDFDFWEGRLDLDFPRRCVVARPLPDYPVAAVRTGQMQPRARNLFIQQWVEEFRFTSTEDRGPGPTGQAP